MKNYIYMIFVIIIVTTPLFSAPEKNDVEKIVKNEITKEINKNKRNQILSEFFSSIFRFIKSTSTFFFYMFIIFGVVTLALIITQVIVRNITTSKYKSQLNNAIIEKHKDVVFNEKTLEDLIKNNDFSKAILYLHRCTIFYLLKNHITYNKNMTNYTLYEKIKKSSLKKAFQNIYLFSEKILFDNYIADNKDMTICKEIYYNNFLTEKT